MSRKALIYILWVILLVMTLTPGSARQLHMHSPSAAANARRLKQNYDPAPIGGGNRRNGSQHTVYNRQD